ncbi:MAG: radical SAM protein [Phycisphaeraceae bacterium]|nr:radical SAM protein [Phycisphaeraceae bacterium]
MPSDPALQAIRDKVLAGDRLTIADGDRLFTTPDIWTVLELADLVRSRLHGDRAYYNINRHMNYSNVCALSCKFCEFYRKKDDHGAYTRDLAYVREQARSAVNAGATEMHVVGGLHPYLPWEYYPQLVAAIREEAHAAGSDLHVKAFTAVEIVHLAKIAKVYKHSDRASGIRWVLSELKAAGLGSLPGGGAEVFDDRVHDEAFKGKIRSDVWLDVHRVAHELGLNTNATILYGHIEQRHDRLVHMEMLRRAQDRALARLGYTGVSIQESGNTEARHPGIEATDSGHLGYAADEGHDVPVITLTRPGIPLPEHVAFGAAAHSVSSSLPHSVSSSQPSSGYFQTIIPLPFIPDGSELEHLPGPTGLENLRTLAIARLMLDNIPHVKAFWIMQTLGMAQLMLQHGADDLDGTVVWYDITKLPMNAQGPSTHQEVTVWDLQRHIREAGFTPVERDTVYRKVVRDGKQYRAAPPF